MNDRLMAHPFMAVSHPSIATWGQWYWPIFVIVSAVWLLTGFGVPETIALIESHLVHEPIDNTLSYYSRRELNVSAVWTIHTIAWYLSLACWTMFVCFLTSHIWFNQVW